MVRVVWLAVREAYSLGGVNQAEERLDDREGRRVPRKLTKIG